MYVLYILRRMFENPKQLFALWPSLVAFAADVEVGYQAAHKWGHRGYIPSDYWSSIIAAAAKRGISGVNADSLMRANISSVENKVQTS